MLLFKSTYESLERKIGKIIFPEADLKVGRKVILVIIFAPIIIMKKNRTRFLLNLNLDDISPPNKDLFFRKKIISYVNTLDA
jgi:hypothetical protein